MSDDAIAGPLVQLVGDASAGYCDPGSGVCVLPTAAETQGPDEPSEIPAPN